MGSTLLRRGDKGNAVSELQTALNKVGAMLATDGDFGPGTERGVLYVQDLAGLPQTGVADTALWAWLESQPMPFEKLNADGVAFIAKEETGGLHYYEMTTRWPHYPGESSGITIGVGYDLRFNSEADFRELWESRLSAAHVAELSRDIGIRGTKARARELKKMGVQVPFKAAWPVFVHLTLPRFYDETKSVYASIDTLPDLCRSVLVSLVFNRGTSLKGSTRTEMKEIQRVLACADQAALTKEERVEILQGVENQILSMKRLWHPTSGLIRRRQSEANLWRQGLAAWQA